MLDTEFIAVYRNNEKKITERWASANLHVKVNIAKRLIPNTFFTAEALQATFTVVDVPAVLPSWGTHGIGQMGPTSPSVACQHINSILKLLVTFSSAILRRQRSVLRHTVKWWLLLHDP